MVHAGSSRAISGTLASTRGEHPSGATTSPWRRCGAGPNGVTGIPVAGACPRSDCGSLRSVRAWEKGWVEGVVLGVVCLREDGLALCF